MHETGSSKRPLAITALLFLCLGLGLLRTDTALALQFTDHAGRDITLSQPPQRVVSLVPSLTEIIFALDAGGHLKGVNSHSTLPAAVSDKAIVGGYFAPCPEEITSLHPDLILASPMHSDLRKRLASRDCRVVTLQTESLRDSYRQIELLGRMFQTRKKAKALVKDIQQQLDLIRQKTRQIPSQEKKRVIRLMGRDQVMTPGQGSFQNEFIELAGGIPPELGKKGQVVPVTREEWQEFDPQVIYGCGKDRQVAEKFFSRPGWRDVEAVEEGRIYWFPCALTCRAATHSGEFVSWLASRIYADEFGQKDNLVLEEEITRVRDINLDLRYVRNARIARSRINDFQNKSLIIDFRRAVRVVSTLEGQRSGIRTVGNHYSPPPCWSLGHSKGLEQVRSHVLEVIGVDPEQASFLFTGADMGNLSVQKQSYKDMTIHALVTAGVKSNALRMSRDTGGYYEPGTINIILLPNMKLSSRAMHRAVISATEAKTAALLDMDVRSAYSPKKHRATGTGTDNILVAEGTGRVLDNAGGHSKLGELIARAVHAGVRDAVRQQNGLVADRSVFHRLRERNISLYPLASRLADREDLPLRDTLSTTYSVLLEPRYAGFLQAALSLSDSYGKGLVTDLSAHESQCARIASDIAGQKVDTMRDLVTRHCPPALEMALNAVLSGVAKRLSQE
jgi:ABC-type Fe3+-hydroxamate transport system substrate-binding protein/adenosylcobinamide amidohydrolase